MESRELRELDSIASPDCNECKGVNTVQRVKGTMTNMQIVLSVKDLWMLMYNANCQLFRTDDRHTANFIPLFLYIKSHTTIPEEHQSHRLEMSHDTVGHRHDCVNA